MSEHISFVHLCIFIPYDSLSLFLQMKLEIKLSFPVKLIYTPKSAGKCMTT